MNLASALIKKVLELQDFETWSYVRKNYLPTEFHSLFDVIDRHCSAYHTMPSFEDLEYSVRDGKTREKLYTVKLLEVDVDPAMLLEYLKNEYAQKEILNSLDDYIDSSIAFEDAEESLSHLHQIVLDVGDKVDLEPPQESMQRINLFDDEEELARYLPLGFNHEYDQQFKFSPRDLILVGGRRGAGKSITCANLANNVYESNRSAIYFTIEMDSRETLQRMCSIATGIPFNRLLLKNLSITEWMTLADWWSGRFIESDKMMDEFKDHRDFDRFHYDLTTKCRLNPEKQLDVVYDPNLTIAKIRTELDKKIKSEMDVGVIIVDYLNQVKRSSIPNPRSGGQYDWTEQIEVSKALKSMAQDFEVPIYSPYQVDATGEARFSKGILDAPDAAFALDAHTQEDECISFKCVKMRKGSMTSFTSAMDWETLRIGPESALTPEEREKQEERTGEAINDLD